MANLKTFSGFPIQNLSSDPVPFAQAKTNDPYQGTWASGAALNTSRIYPAGIGTTNSSALAVGGFSGTAAIANNESYNGTSWTELNDLNSGRYGLNGRGTSTSGIVYAGITTARVGNTETWNGTNWTEVNDLSTVRYRAGASGTQTAALCFGGENPGGADIANNESWNGSTWTELADLNTARNGLSGGGTQTDGLAFAGETTVATGATEIWNGSAWTEVADLNTARFRLAGASQVQNASLAIAGGPPNTAATEDWNGSVWTEVNDLSTARHALGGTGSNTSAIAFGGETPSVAVSNLTEEWAFSGIPPTAPAAGYSDAIVGQMYYNSTSGQFKAINAGVGSWASGGNLNNSRNSGNITGNASSAMNAGGEVSPSAASNYVENYNGTSWTEVTEMGTARGRPALTNTNGNSDVLLISGGASPLGSTNAINNVEKWDGSSWTEIAEVNTARLGGQAFGITTASIFSGGYTPGDSIVTNTEYWNGSSWTELNDMSTLRVNFANWGVYNSGGMAGGSSPTRALHETWDGTSWTETTDMNTGRSSLGGGGASSSSGMVFGGTTTPGTQSDDTEIWDGSSWTEVGDLGQTDGEATGSSPTVGSSIAKLDNPSKNQTEEWSLPDFTINPVTTS